jgi:hypothetical protein
MSNKKRIILPGPIPDMKTVWDDGTHAYAGEDVENFIKERINEKGGDFFVDDSVDAYLTLYLFRNNEDKTAWMLDKNKTELVLSQQTFNVASRHGEGTAYVVTLAGKDIADPKFTNKRQLIVPLKFTCKRATTVAGSTTTEDMAGTSGTIVVSGRKAGISGNFQKLTPIDGITRYIDAVSEDSDIYTNFDLGPYLQDGEWNYRINVVEPENSTSSTAVAVNVTMSESMGLEYAGDLGHVFEGNSVVLPFYVKGSVARNLHLQILNSTGDSILAEPESIAFAANEGGSETVQNITIASSQYTFHHGTYRIRAWLTFASDTKGTKVSEQTFGIMFKESGNQQVLVAVADAITEAENYDTVTLLRYAVYNPNETEYQLDMSIVDGLYGETVYYEESKMCTNGVTYELRTALNCEHELGDFSVLVKIKHDDITHYSGAVLLSNDMDFSPRGTADLVLNANTRTFYGADTRGNSFTFNPETLQLIDQAPDNKTKIVNPTVEGFIREDGIDRFRMNKGSLLDLPFEPIITTTGLKVSGVDYSLTMEFDIKISKIVDESAPVISCFSETASSFVGLKVLPNRAIFLGSGQGPISTPDMADYYLEEDRRIHLVINIVNNLRNEGLNYMRIFADGVLQREYTYQNSQTSPFCGPSGSNGHLIIGSTGCNIDIFGMRIMIDESMSSTYIQQDYKASMSSIDGKKAFVEANDNIMNGDVIDYNKAKEIYNTILYELPSTATYPTFNNDPGSINNVKMTVLIIGDDKHSGVFSSCEIKRQGSTAKKYYWPNLSSKLCKADESKGIVKGTFTSIGVDPNTGKPYYDQTTYYQLDDNQPKATKFVGKSNYASSMQSHKIGATAAFNDLYRLCAMPNGGFTYDQYNPTTPSRRSVLQKPFLCFYTDKNHSTPTFCGFQTWGAAKGDKATFGYDDDEESVSYTPDYIMIEGADNNVPGANFETPWIPSEMQYVADEESFCYNGAPNFDFDLGALNEDETHPTGGAITSLNNYIIPAFNMLYLCNPNLRWFNGGLDALNQAYLRDKAKQEANITEGLELEANVHYWNADPSSSEYLNVYRMDYVNDVWVNAGVSRSSSKDSKGFNNINVTVLNLKTQLNITDQDLFGMNNDEKNVELIKRRVALFKQQFGTYFDVSDMLFQRCMNLLWSGTDNNTKNTYYWIEGNIDHKIRMDCDDVDTIFRTDNKGQQSKPYWILFDDKDPYDAWYWNGRDNALCRLIDLAYPDDCRTMMNKIFTAMVTISGSVDNFFQQYFFSVQEYYPAVAYNETARLLYETAQLYYDGIHPSEPGVSYGYKEMPITQSLGNQLHAEREYITKRLALMESYANFGDFSLNGTDSITFTSTGNSTYNIKYTAYQDIFPVAAFGQALDYGTDSNGVKHTSPWRLKAGDTCSFITAMSGETTVSIHGMSFCAEISNLGANAIKGNLRLSGKRLRKLVMPRLNTSFKPSSIILASNLDLEEIDWRDIDFSDSNPSFNFTSMYNLNKLDLSGCTGVTGVDAPKTAALVEMRLPSGLSRLELFDMPSLTTFSIDNVSDLINVLVNVAGINTMELAGEIYNNSKKLLTISLYQVNWSGFPVSMLMWLASKNPYSYGVTSEKYPVMGKIIVDQSQGRLTFANKKILIEKFGNIDATSGVPLSLTYDKYQINSVAITGTPYIKETGTVAFGVNVTPVTSNNLAIIVEEDGTAHEDIKFGFIGTNGEEIVPVQYCNWQDAVRGLLNVTKVTTEASGTRYTLRVQVGTIVGAERRVLTSDMMVGFYLRHPKLGDFAYADGTFDDQYQKDKTMIGMVYKLDPMYKGEDDAAPITYSGFTKPTNDVIQSKQLVGYKVLIDCKENATIKSTDNFINTSSNQWGLYQEGSAEVHGTNGFSSVFGSEVASEVGLSSIFDTSLTNYTSRGLTGGTNNDYLLTGNCLDQEQDDGFKDYSDSAGMINDWSDKNNTKAIVRHMEQIFNGYLLGGNNTKIETQWTDNSVADTPVIKSIESLPQTLEELGNVMEILQKANGDLAIFRQFAYPAAYSCYLYEPKVQDGEYLDPQYKKNNWYLPSSGELSRQFIYFALSRTGGWGENYTSGQNTLPDVSVIDKMILEAYNSAGDNYIKSNVSYEHITSGEYTTAEIMAINQYFQSMIDSEKPLYSLLSWRAFHANGSSPFTHHTTGYHWSSTENGSNSVWIVYFNSGFSYYNYGKYNSYVVRPAVAYEFTL